VPFVFWFWEQIYEVLCHAIESLSEVMQIRILIGIRLE